MDASIRMAADIGGSATKICAVNAEGKLMGTLLMPSLASPADSLYRALEDFFRRESLAPDCIRSLSLTGQRATFFQENVMDIPTRKVDEIAAIGRGGLLLSGLPEALVVSLGTGTAFVRAARAGIRHVGGSALGGGTLTGLAERFLHIRDFQQLMELAAKGDRKKADLMVSDLQGGDGSSLSGDLTASNFGHIRPDADDADMAAALFHMIYENIGVFAVFALNGDSIRDVVLTGALSDLPMAAQCYDIFNRMEDVFHVRFHLPPLPAFAPALGAIDGPVNGLSS